MQQLLSELLFSGYRRRVLGLLLPQPSEALHGREIARRTGGRKVDLRTAAELSRHFRDEVLRTAEVQYVAG